MQNQIGLKVVSWKTKTIGQYLGRYSYYINYGNDIVTGDLNGDYKKITT
jgi:hypothetical protein